MNKHYDKPYRPALNGAVSGFRHQILYDYIQKINKDTNAPATFYVTENGVEAGEDPFRDLSEQMSPWHMELSLNVLEASGKVRLFPGPRHRYGPHIAAVISDLILAVMPSASSADTCSKDAPQADEAR